MDKLLYGVGLNGYDSKINVNGKILKFYKVWQSMILNTIVAIPHILVVAYAKSGIALQHLKNGLMRII